MSREVAVLEAAFALRDSGTASASTSQELHGLLPAALPDIAEPDRLTLSGEVLRRLSGDSHAMAFISAHIQGTGTVYKSFAPPIETEPPPTSAFVCPVDGKNPWSRPDKSYAIPECPVHHVTLVSKPRA